MQTKFRWRVSSVTTQLLIHNGLSIETRTFLSQIILLLLHSLVSQSVKSIVIFLYQRHVAIHRLLSKWTRKIFALRKANICCGGRAKRDYEEFWMNGNLANTECCSRLNYSSSSRDCCCCCGWHERELWGRNSRLSPTWAATNNW